MLKHRNLIVDVRNTGLRSMLRPWATRTFTNFAHHTPIPRTGQRSQRIKENTNVITRNNLLTINRNSSCTLHQNSVVDTRIGEMPCWLRDSICHRCEKYQKK